MFATKRPFLYFAIALAALALLFGMWYQYNTADKTKQKVNLAVATVFPTPRTVPAFDLISDQRKPLTTKNLQGHWSLLFFGFTSCPDLCPTTLSTLNESYLLLQEEKTSPMPQVVFISVDPERDRPKRIAKYLSSFNKHFIGATGSQEQLQKLTQAFNILYAKVNPTNKANDYSIDHSGTILMIDPKGQLYAIFSTPHDAKQIAHDVKAIMDNYKAT